MDILAGSKNIKPKDWERIYKAFMLTAIKDDCGKLCAPDEDDIPICCNEERALPVLYKSEYDFVIKRTKMWKKLKPRTATEKKIVEETDDDNVYVRCRGHKACDRDYRGITCRIFPFYPYLNLDGELLGLCYNYAVDDDCWLVDKPEIVEREYIERTLEFWEFIFERMPEEKELFMEESTNLRRLKSRQKKQVIVMTPNGFYYGSYKGDGESSPRRMW